jgi:hypothetical protein
MIILAVTIRNFNNINTIIDDMYLNEISCLQISIIVTIE